MALIMLSVAIAYFINWNGDGLPLMWAFTIVFAFYLLVTAILAFVGYRKFKKVRAPRARDPAGRGGQADAHALRVVPERGSDHAAQPWVDTARELIRPRAAACATCADDSA